MKKLLIVLPLLLMIISCTGNKSSDGRNSTNNVSVITYSDSIVITNEFEVDASAPDIFKPGRIEPISKSYSSCETNMINQFNDYSKAIVEGDYDKCIAYLNKDALKYMQKLAAADGERLELKELAKMMSEDMNEFLEKFRKHGVKVSMVLASLERRIDDGDDIFIVFKNTTNFVGENGKHFHMVPIEETLGISHDKGNSWTFIAFGDDVPNYLNEAYNENVINAIMDY